MKRCHVEHEVHYLETTAGGDRQIAIVKLYQDGSLFFTMKANFESREQFEEYLAQLAAAVTAEDGPPIPYSLAGDDPQ